MKNNRYILKIPNNHAQRSELSRKEEPFNINTAQKSQKITKSSSLPTSYQVHNIRFNNFSELYRAISNDKPHSHSSKTKRNSPLYTPQKRKPFSPCNNLKTNPYASTLCKSKKLVLQRSNQNNESKHVQNSNSLMQISVKLRCISTRLQQLLSIKNNELFVNELLRYCNSLEVDPQKKNNKQHSLKQYLNNCLRLLHNCHQRKQQIVLLQLQQNYHNTQQEINNLQNQLKKKTIKAQLEQKQTQITQLKNQQLQKQIEQLNQYLNRPKASIAVNTDFLQNSNSHTKDTLLTQNTFMATQNLAPSRIPPSYNKKDCQCWQQIIKKDLQLAQSLKKIHQYNRRQQELLAVLVLLKKEGINIEQAYDAVLTGNIQIDEQQNQTTMNSISQIRKQQTKIYHKLKNIKINSSFEADHSIVSSADGLSFDYQDKSLEDDAYTIRHQYICKQDLGEEMRNRLKLNFSILYDQQIYNDDTQSQNSQPNASVPTI